MTDLLARHAIEGNTPEGALALWLTACLYVQSGNAGMVTQGFAALRHLTLPFRDDPDWQNRFVHSTFVDRLARDSNVVRAHHVGSRPESGYACDRDGDRLEVTRRAPGPGGAGAKLFVHFGGADSPRPAVLKPSPTSGRWFVKHFGSLYMGSGLDRRVGATALPSWPRGCRRRSGRRR